MNFLSTVAYAFSSVVLKRLSKTKIVMILFGLLSGGRLNTFTPQALAMLLGEGDQIGISAIASLALVCVGIYICNSGQDGRRESI